MTAPPFISAADRRQAQAPGSGAVRGGVGVNFDGRIRADARHLPIASDSVQCVVTSPPYFGGIRDYFMNDQIGLERHPQEYVAEIVAAMAEAHRVLKADGSLWLNIGDVYAASGKGGGGTRAGRSNSWASIRDRKGFRSPPVGYKLKDITLSPFLVANSLREWGWYLRSTIIWSKPVAIEPARIDRPSRSHEYLFLLTKSRHSTVRNPLEPWWFRTVWEIQPDSSSDHAATMPRELVRRCIIASTTIGDFVMDPFAGSGTVAMVSEQLGRRWIAVDLGYQDLQAKRLKNLQRVLA
jgi:site-specific DNA-methyltransferase (cytosine-N4-specific)